VSEKKSAATGRQQGPSLDKQLLEIVYDWIERVQEAEREHLEAEIDRASFESFPASDPASPATASQGESKVRIDCELGADRLVFSRALRTDDPTGPDVRGEPVGTIDGETPSGVRVRIGIRHPLHETEETTPENLELPPEHASIAPKIHKGRRS
jgi:hypothetical protein